MSESPGNRFCGVCVTVAHTLRRVAGISVAGIGSIVVTSLRPIPITAGIVVVVVVRVAAVIAVITVVASGIVVVFAAVGWIGVRWVSWIG